MSWNEMHPEINMQYLQHVRHEGRSADRSLGQTSSIAAGQHQNERKAEHTTQSSRSRAVLTLEEPSSNPSLNANVGGHSHGVNSSSGTLPHDLNMSSGFLEEDEDDDCQVIEHPSTYVTNGGSSAGISSDSFGFVVEESQDQPGCSSDSRRMSCKRKALEVQHVGQSSGVGSSTYFPNAERSQWHTVPPAAQIPASNISMSTPTENDRVIHTNPRLQLGVEGAVSSSPFSLTTASGSTESSQRNPRLRINSSHQQAPIPGNPSSTVNDVGHVDVSSTRHSSRLVRRSNRLLNLNSSPAAHDNGSLHGQSVIPHAPYVRRHPHSRWSSISYARAGSSSTPAISEERDVFFYDEPASRNIPRTISEHPMFVPSSETGNSSQDPLNPNLAGGVNVIPGNVASTSRVGSSARINTSTPALSHQSFPQYPRRLSEIVRRSLLSSAGTEFGGPSSSNDVPSSSAAAASQEMAYPGQDSHGHRAPNSRSALLERHLEGALGVHHSLRSLAAASERRSSVMSEIRQVLDRMRRGEGVRFEDLMILDHSVLFGMTDIHDRHRDMRLDVDNMSYEELLALGERIGDVCTGLSEETIMTRLKQKKYADDKTQDQMQTEPCSICREEYNDGEDLGILECGHEFHKDCIKQWLMHKNLCPICKTTGLTT